MKHILCSGERKYNDEDIIELGTMTFAIEKDWLKWPEDIPAKNVLNAVWAEDGFLYAVTGQKDAPVAVFDHNGCFTASFGRDIIVKSHNISETNAHTFLIADADAGMHVVRETDREGNLLRTWGTEGIPGDTGYDAGAWKKMEAEGRKPEETPWNHDPASNARTQSIVRRGQPFNRPCAMIQTADGEYYAADGYGNCAVHRFDRNGELIQSWGEPGTAPGQFRIVHEVLVDRYDRVWIADRENARVQAFTRDGELLAVVDGNLSRAGGIALDEHCLYIGELDGGITVIAQEDLECIGQAGAPKTFMRAHGITLDKDGNIYISTNKANPVNIIRFRKIS